MLVADRIARQRLLRARRALAGWLSEHGEENAKYVALVEALDAIDAALNAYEEA